MTLRQVQALSGESSPFHDSETRLLEKVALGLSVATFLVALGVAVSIALGWAFSPDKVAAVGNFYGEAETDVARLRTLPGPPLGIFGAEDQMLPPLKQL